MSALPVPTVFRERLFSDLKNTQVWAVRMLRLSPIALFLGYIQTWQGFCHTVQQTSMQAGVGEQEGVIRMMGLIHSENIKAQNEGLFP